MSNLMARVGPHAARRAMLESSWWCSRVMERVGNGWHTRRFSGTVLDRGSVRNTNPRPPLDEVGAMRIARGDALSKLNL
jgi:hypothetical protein